MNKHVRQNWILLGVCTGLLGVAIASPSDPPHSPREAQFALQDHVDRFNLICNATIQTPSVILTNLDAPVIAQTVLEDGAVYLDRGYAAREPRRAVEITMPHEAAHVIADSVYGLILRAHGSEYEWALGFVEGRHQNCRM